MSVGKDGGGIFPFPCLTHLLGLPTGPRAVDGSPGRMDDAILETSFFESSFFDVILYLLFDMVFDVKFFNRNVNDPSHLYHLISLYTNDFRQYTLKLSS